MGLGSSRYADPNGDSYCYADGNTANAHYVHTNAYSYSHGDSYRHGNAYAYAYATHAHSTTYILRQGLVPATKASANSAAETLILKPASPQPWAKAGDQ